MPSGDTSRRGAGYVPGGHILQGDTSPGGHVLQGDTSCGDTPCGDTPCGEHVLLRGHVPRGHTHVSETLKWKRCRRPRKVTKDWGGKLRVVTSQ